MPMKPNSFPSDGDQPHSLTLAVDALGGYHAPEAIVEAVAEASLESADAPVYFTLVGDERELTDILLDTSHNPERLNIEHTDQRVEHNERPGPALDAKPAASINVAAQLVAHGDADAIVSAGHPGAAVLAGSRHIGRLQGIPRAALAAVYPTPRERGPHDDPFSLLLDVGATLRADAEDLLHFALMGTAYSRVVTGLDRPRVALLSTARERHAGPPEIARATALLENHRDIEFYGNYEGHDIPSGSADVIVCEGMVGDVAIKILEGVSEAAFDLARSASEQKLIWRMGLRLLSGGLDRLQRLTDFNEYGGAPLLGVRSVMILAHPRSEARAIGNALKLAIKSHRAGLPTRISSLLTSESSSDNPDD
jgi:glycerol-3-phosphate acyltransferase PlsX